MTVAWNWKHNDLRSYGEATGPNAAGYCASWAEVQPMEDGGDRWRAKIVADLEDDRMGRATAARRHFATREAAIAWCEQSLPTLLAVLT